MNRLSVGLAVGAVLAALAVGLLPGSTAPATPSVVVAGVGIGSIGLGVVLWIQQGSSGRSTELSREPSASADDRVGQGIDGVIRSSTPDLSRRGQFRIRREVRGTLETVLVERGGLSSVEAIDRRKTGRWTSNPRAATFLGEADVRPWGMRARDWVRGGAFARNLRATIAELDRLVTDLERTHRVESLWDRDHRDDGDVGVTTAGIRGGAGADAVASRRARGSPEGSFSRADRERLDDAIDERASALGRSNPDESTDRSGVTAESDVDEVSR